MVIAAGKTLVATQLDDSVVEDLDVIGAALGWSRAAVIREFVTSGAALGAQIAISGSVKDFREALAIRRLPEDKHD